MYVCRVVNIEAIGSCWSTRKVSEPMGLTGTTMPQKLRRSETKRLVFNNDIHSAH